MTPISAADFLALRRQMRGEDLDRLVANIEAAWRSAIRVPGEWSDDEVICALYQPEGQTAEERAGLRVIRMCIAYREATDGADVWLDDIQLALSDANALGTQQAARGKASGLARDPLTSGKYGDLPRLIELALRREGSTREYTAEWCERYSISRSALYDLINRVKQGSPKK